MLQQDFHNWKMSKATGTMKRNVIILWDNPIHIDSWVIGKVLDKISVPFRAGIKAVAHSKLP